MTVLWCILGRTNTLLSTLVDTNVMFCAGYTISQEAFSPSCPSTNRITLRGWHTIDLWYPVKGRDPADSLGNKQLSGRPGVVQDFDIIQDPDLDDSHAIFTPKCLAPTE